MDSARRDVVQVLLGQQGSEHLGSDGLHAFTGGRQGLIEVDRCPVEAPIPAKDSRCLTPHEPSSTLLLFSVHDNMVQEATVMTAIAEEIARPRFWVLLTASLFFLFTSTVWEAHEVQTEKSNQQLTDQAHRTPESQSSGSQEERVLALFTPEPYIALLRELGFGCLIAFVLILCVERSARQEQARSADKQRVEISKNVFQGVFSLHTPAAIVEAACEQIFKAKVVREHHRSDYHLTELEDTSYDTHIVERFVKLDMTSDYILRNVSDEEIEIPIRLGFPVPPLPQFRSLVGVHAVSIGGRPLTREQISEGDRASDDPPDRIRYLWLRSAPPNGTIHVVASYTLIKERSDNEVWQTLYAGPRMELTLNVNVRGLEFGVHSLHEKSPVKLSGSGDVGSHRWLLDAPVLPHQGMVLWWRPKESPATVDTGAGITSQTSGIAEDTL